MKLTKKLRLGFVKLDSINGGTVKIGLFGDGKVVWRGSFERMREYGLFITNELLLTPPDKFSEHQFELTLESKPTPIMKWNNHDTLDYKKSVGCFKVKKLIGTEEVSWSSSHYPPRSFVKKEYTLSLRLDSERGRSNIFNHQEFDIKLTEDEYKELSPLVKNGSGVVFDFNFEHRVVEKEKVKPLL